VLSKVTRLFFEQFLFESLTLNPPMWKISWAPNSASRWLVGFNSALKGL